MDDINRNKYTHIIYLRRCMSNIFIQIFRNEKTTLSSIKIIFIKNDNLLDFCLYYSLSNTGNNRIYIFSLNHR